MCTNTQKQQVHVHDVCTVKCFTTFQIIHSECTGKCCTNARWNVAPLSQKYKKWTFIDSTCIKWNKTHAHPTSMKRPHTKCVMDQTCMLMCIDRKHIDIARGNVTPLHGGMLHHMSHVWHCFTQCRTLRWWKRKENPSWIESSARVTSDDSAEACSTPRHTSGRIANRERRERRRTRRVQEHVVEDDVAEDDVWRQSRSARLFLETLTSSSLQAFPGARPPLNLLGPPSVQFCLDWVITHTTSGKMAGCCLCPHLIDVPVQPFHINFQRHRHHLCCHRETPPPVGSGCHKS